MTQKPTLTLDEVKERLYGRYSPTVMSVDIEAQAETIHKILTLKAKHNVTILGHNYMEPLVFSLSEEHEQGDSLGLSLYASKTDADYIIFNGVPFMAETAKILNPEKTVLVADKTAGCSLADNYRGEDVRALKEQYPGIPVMIYINSYADAKAESDITCTSANAANIARNLPGDKVLFVPDILFAQNLEEELKEEKEIIYPGKGNNYKGAVCEVHERFSLNDIEQIRYDFDIPKGHPQRMVYAHWECKPEVLRNADFYGSTTQIRQDIARRVNDPNLENRLEKAFIASECELTSNLQNEFPNVEFATACYVRCQHMAKTTLPKILNMLEAIDNGENLSKYEVNLSNEVIESARLPIERMLEYR